MSIPSSLLSDSDHTGHRHSPEYARMLAAYRADAEPVRVALEANGWVEVTVDDPIDCEFPEAPTAVEVVAWVPAGQLGKLLVRARVVRGRSATQGDVHQVIGGAALGAQIAMLVADDLEAGVAIPERLLLWRSLADVGLTD